MQIRNMIYDMHDLVTRDIELFVNENLSIFPAVAILGPRQCGKSTLVKMLYQHSDAYLYLDLQNMEDLNKLQEPMLFFQANQECKASSAPQVTKGFWNAIDTVQPDKAYIIAPVSSAYPFKNGVEVCRLTDFLTKAPWES